MDISILILICTMLSTGGVLADNIQSKIDKRKITNKLGKYLISIDRFDYAKAIEASIDVSRKSILMPFDTAFQRIGTLIILAVMSGFVTYFALEISNGLVDPQGAVYMYRGTMALIIVIFLFAVPWTISIFISLTISFIYIFMLLSKSDAAIELGLVGETGGWWRGVAIGFVNFFFDAATVAVTLHCLKNISVASTIKACFYVLIDILFALFFGILACYFTLALALFSGIANPGDASVVWLSYISIATMLIEVIDGKFQDHSIVFLAYGGTTFVPTVFYLSMVLFAISMKPVIGIVRWLSLKTLIARIDDDDPKIYTVMGLYISLLLLIIKLVHAAYAPT